jgi:hypothetical protein
MLDDRALALAGVVALIELMDPRCSWSRGRIVTRFVGSAREMFKGSPANPLAVVLPGGTVDGIGMRAVGYPELKAGDRAILLLVARNGSTEHHLVGASRGCLPVVRDNAGVDIVGTFADSAVPSMPLDRFRPMLLDAIARSARHPTRR